MFKKAPEPGEERPLTEDEQIKRTLDIHSKVRGLRKNPEALDDLAIESFLRIVGIFDTLPKQIKEDARFDATILKFNELREFIDVQLASDDGKNFAKYDMADYVHNLQLLLVELVQLDYLEANIHNVREEYRNHVGDITYRIYTLSKSFEFLDKYWHADPLDPQFVAVKPIYEEKLRIDYGNLINEIRKARLYEFHIEGTRRYLIKKVLNVVLGLIALPLMVIVVYLWKFQDPGKNPSVIHTDVTGIVLFSAAAVAGAIGSFVSVVLRIQGIRDNTELAQNIFAFKYSKTTVQMAPLTGMIFAILLSFVLYGGLIGGSMFPKISFEAKDTGVLDANSYVQVLNKIGELSKLLVWSFIAGFSERLMPDMVDRLSDKARRADEKFAN